MPLGIFTFILCSFIFNMLHLVIRDVDNGNCIFVSRYLGETVGFFYFPPFLSFLLSSFSSAVSEGGKKE